MNSPHRYGGDSITDTAQHASGSELYTHLCIVNENAFELILSYLSNQALAKLQTITGDNYPHCEPNLAQYCCSCQNDNPVMLSNMCRECESECDNYNPLVKKEVATTLYGLKVQDLAECPRYRRFNETLYSRIDLDNYMIQVYGSKMEWVREIARRDMVQRAIEAMQQHEQDEINVFMESLAPGFAMYASLSGLEDSNRNALVQCSQRYVELAVALNARGLQLRTDSELCQQYIALGSGGISSVVDTREEMEFLTTCTDYSRRCRRVTLDSQHGNPYGILQDYQEQAKLELCVAYLENPRGLKLPRRWECCRLRFEEVRQAGGNPLNELRYIYGPAKSE
ncbi:unnamed protein product [Phytophthora fragariaefolia]|uniref:Unnamed protein product n=1 Tax=Phytophthora fragariaefolia TaxID=1490495 RepID=A0A9W6X2N3_9STRA|nr:unnamed protein product [Phytophthora fragariaefolia]